MTDSASAFLTAVLWMVSPAGTRAIEVRGDTTCPRATQVQTALDGMVQPARAAADVVELVGHGDGVDVRLLNAAGERVAERRLPAGRSCVERAEAAAVIVAAWEVRLGAGQQLALPAVPGAATRGRNPAGPVGNIPPAVVPPPPAAPVVKPLAVAVAAAPATPAATPGVTPPPAAPVAAPAVPAPSPESPRLPAAQPSGKANVEVVTARRAESPSRPVEIEMAAGVMASLVSKELASGASLEARLSRAESDFAVGISGFAIDTHTIALDPGQGRWRRFGGIVDLRSVAKWRVIRLDLRAGLALGALVVTGQSFPVNAGGTLLDAGAVLGLRSLFHLGRLSPWVEASAAAWPSTRALYVTGTDRSADIPTFELFLGVGVALTANR